MMELPEAVKQGWLLKRSQFLGVFKRRWLVLTHDRLFTFEDTHCSGAPTSDIDLTCARVQIVESWRPLMFAVEASNASTYFQATTVDERDEWIAAICRATPYFARDQAAADRLAAEAAQQEAERLAGKAAADRLAAEVAVRQQTADKAAAESALQQAQIDRRAAEAGLEQAAMERVQNATALESAENILAAAKSLQANAKADRLAAEAAQKQAEQLAAKAAADRLAVESASQQQAADKPSAESARQQAQRGQGETVAVQAQARSGLAHDAAALELAASKNAKQTEMAEKPVATTSLPADPAPRGSAGRRLQQKSRPFWATKAAKDKGQVARRPMQDVTQEVTGAVAGNGFPIGSRCKVCVPNGTWADCRVLSFDGTHYGVSYVTRGGLFNTTAVTQASLSH